MKRSTTRPASRPTPPRRRFAVSAVLCFLPSVLSLPALVASDRPVLSSRAVPGAASSAAALPARASLKLDSEFTLAAPSPIALFRIGEQLIVFSTAGAWLVAPTGEVRPMAGGRDRRDFGVVSARDGAFLVGGLAAGQPSAEVWRLTLDGEVLDWALAATLPAPCVAPACVLAGSDLLAAGRAGRGEPFLVRIPGPGGRPEVMALPPRLAEPVSLGVQGEELFLAGRDAEGVQRFWGRELGRWSPRAPPPEILRPLAPVAIGPAHLLYATANPERPLLAHHLITDTWSAWPATGECLALLPWRQGLVRAVRQGDGSWRLRQETIVHPKRGLVTADYLMLGGYFGLNLLIGFWCGRSRGDSGHFFLGGGRIQWWALGISYMATGMSSISFMAYPATAYATNWLMMGVPVFQSAAVVAAGFLFIRLFRRLGITTVFEYLEQRFGRSVRLLGATLMIMGQIGGRLSIIMLLPAMAFSAVTGLNVYASVWLMGLVTVTYCLKGGMKAVVWTDVLQFVLMYGTLALAVATIAQRVPGGLGELWSTARAEGKLEALLLDWDFVRPSVWVFACLAVTTVFLQLGDQTLMQRALSAPDEKAARNSVILAGILGVPISLLLFFVGSALFVFYRQEPAAIDPTLPNDSIFPFFVGTELPVGLVGLVIAGIFAAAMSTVSGSVNAIAAILVRDFLLSFRPHSTERTQMKVARAGTVLAGGLATVIAAIMAGMDIQSLWVAFAALVALIGGGFPGIFALGLLTRRANAPGVIIGLGASVAATFAVKEFTDLNVFLYTSVAVDSCALVGYGASLLFPPPAHSLAGLTVHDLPGSNAGSCAAPAVPCAVSSAAGEDPATTERTAC